LLFDLAAGGTGKTKPVDVDSGFSAALSTAGD
jgi:hypothetical protein